MQNLMYEHFKIRNSASLLLLHYSITFTFISVLCLCIPIALLVLQHQYRIVYSTNYTILDTR